MEADEIIKGNKLISEFMGECKDDLLVFGANRYDNNWNHIMPVVAKINSLHWNESNGNFSPILDMFLENNIGNIWQNVVQFITWYNTNKS